MTRTISGQPSCLSKCVALLCLVASMHALAASALHGRIVNVHDGDTLTALVDGRQITIRVADIDAPELQQSFGQAAQRALSDMCAGADAVIRPKTNDAYGRLVAEVECKGRDVGVGMAATGYAWAFTKYAPRKTVVDAADAAKRSQRGLWIATNPQAPWDFRQNKRSDDAPSVAASKPGVDAFLSRVPDVGGGASGYYGSSESRVGGGSSSSTVHRGPRGGQYVIGGNGEKNYLSRDDPRRK